MEKKGKDQDSGQKNTKFCIYIGFAVNYLAKYSTYQDKRRQNEHETIIFACAENVDKTRRITKHYRIIQ